MNLRKSFLIFISALLITHLLQGLLLGIPLIGIFIWSLPLIIFGYKAYKSPSAKLYQVFGFIILIYFMVACVRLEITSLLSWVELIEIVALFLVAVYAAREQLNVK